MGPFTPELVAIALIVALVPAVPVLLQRRHAGGGPASVQTLHVTVREIADDAITFADGRRCAVLEVGAVNFGMLGEAKQDELVAAYEGFLLGLGFPLQILVRAAPLDLEPYLEAMVARAGAEPSARLRRLAHDRIAFLRQQAATRHLLERRCYVVIPADDPRPAAALPLPGRGRGAGPDPTGAAAIKQLAFRCDDTAAQLARFLPGVRRLADHELAELTYACWCAELSRVQRLRGDLRRYLGLVVTTGRHRRAAPTAARLAPAGRPERSAS